MFGNKIIKLLRSKKSIAFIPLFGLPMLDKKDYKTKEILMEYMKDYNAITLDDHNYNLITYEMCEEFVKNNPELIANIPEKYMDERMCKNVILINPNNITFIPEKHITNNICEFIIGIHPNFYFLLPEIHKTLHIRKKVSKIYDDSLENNPNNLSIIPKEFVNDTMIIKAFTNTNGKINNDTITKFNISQSLRNEFNEICLNKTYYNLTYDKFRDYKDSYCYHALQNFHPKLPSNE